MTEIKQGSIIRYRKPGMPAAKVGRVEWAYTDAFTGEPYYRVRPDIGRRAEVHLADIERAEKPMRQQRQRAHNRELHP